MSIQVKCDNGHVLAVDERNAGKTGQCPICKARVTVPAPQPKKVSEDAVLDFLGPHVPRESLTRVDPVTAAPPSTDGPTTPKKSCQRCNREIPSAMHICPYCHTYLVDLTKS
jgi:RNA polymerase subunit RPABC4/transcription elongation factor Spt4